MRSCPPNTEVDSVLMHDVLGLFSCENVVLWRGHFEATGTEKSVNLSVNGGEGIYHSVQMMFFPPSDYVPQPFLPVFGLTTSSSERRSGSTFIYVTERDICLMLQPSSTNNRRIIEETDDKFEFPVGALRAGEDNVITIVQVKKSS